MLQPGGTPTKIVCLTQVVTADDLRDDEEYADIIEDMRQEGLKFGKQFDSLLFFHEILPLVHTYAFTRSKLLIIHCCVQVTW